MQAKPASETNFQLLDLHPEPAGIRREVLEGLRKNPKELPPKLFYDQRGSELFEEITRLPEYYLTRTEISILEKHADAMASLLGRDPALIEFGSGSSRKVRILLDRVEGKAIYTPIDIARQPLANAARAIAEDYPNVMVIAVCADYTQSVELGMHDRQRTIFFPGSNLGNLTGPEAKIFFRRSARMLRKGDGMLIGIDRKKDPAVLHAAYNDSRGITAEFSLNVLRRINRELGAGFDLAQFEHVAFYNEEEGRIEMHLRSKREQVVTIANERFHFATREMIHTENSYKYTDEDLYRLIEGSGFELTQSWNDDREWFSVHSLRVY